MSPTERVWKMLVDRFGLTGAKIIVGLGAGAVIGFLIGAGASVPTGWDFNQLVLISTTAGGVSGAAAGAVSPTR